MTKIHEHDVVVLLTDMDDQKLVAGDTGTVVHIYPGDVAYEVEFPDPTGHQRYVVVTVEADKLLKLRQMGLQRLAG